MVGSETDLASHFVEFSRRKLSIEFWPRICTCLDSLTEEQVWWRPNESSNSIGNLLLHLNGNVRQWIVSALGGSNDNRDRSAEFAERDHIPLAALRSRLDATMKEVDSILESLHGPDLVRTYTIQQHGNVTAMEAVYQVVGHFAMHYGQILYITKFLTAQDLGFFRHLK